MNPLECESVHPWKINIFSKQSSVATLGVLTVIVKAWCSSRWFHTCAAFLVILIQISKEVSHTTWSWHPYRQKLPHRPFLTEISIEMASPDVTLGLSDCSQWHGANSALARATLSSSSLPDRSCSGPVQISRSRAQPWASQIALVALWLVPTWG
jgi:hypothetical protein